MTVKMLAALLFYLCISDAYSFTSHGTLDLAELHSVQYSVEILDTPVEDTTEDTKDQVRDFLFVGRLGRQLILHQSGNIGLF